MVEINTGILPVNDRIIAAKKVALSPDRSNAIRHRQNSLHRKFLAGDINFKTFLKKSDVWQDPGVLIVDSAEGLTEALSCLKFDSDWTAEMVEHEKTHYMAAQNAGLSASFGVRFVKVDGVGKFSNVFTRVIFPEDLDDEVARQLMRSIACAPGNNMSPSDKQAVPHI